MRNDTLDELDTVPSLKTDDLDRDDFAQHRVERGQPLRAVAAPARSSTGPLWALIAALLMAMAGLAWWSFQQIVLMEQQLVATQESFAKISEDAAGRLQDISGKVVAAESSSTTEAEALKLRVKQLENKLAELSRQQQNVAVQQTAQGKRLEQVSSELKSQQGSADQLASQVKTLGAEQSKLQQAQAGISQQGEQIKQLSAAVESLKKQGNPSQAISRLEQDLLVLRSELDAPAASNSTAEFDAFRAQMARNISTLQAQVVNLQQQIDAQR
ncbi:ATPase [Pseudomonas sp. HAR-UPW-AIA-41]|uniref:ATPase n=1 Tax=Pseudomonas sp. HAR-UPW-AIA-41 TaxID=1985301 RepID=UPI000BB331C0|nr:ATPase [Pseudomonas sp. HAR-UPW-AIA-41]PAV47810.1 ATPase [Pseudomonas sp. HAR-UPW-AIA-41]